jgi:2-oxo-4-hydroxy-4-carboxy-5-ureidoimidazoline decarboxylase
VTTLSVAELDELPAAPAAEALRECCGSARWVAEMVARRPYHTLDAVLAEAEEVWWSLDPDDWLEAFAHHPRIGDRATGEPAREQAGMDHAGDAVRAAMAEANDEYERRFGHIYIVCATGKSADEMLALARARLTNDPDAELRVAAEEQLKITRLRLAKLLEEEA